MHLLFAVPDFVGHPGSLERPERQGPCSSRGLHLLLPEQDRVREESSGPGQSHGRGDGHLISLRFVGVSFQNLCSEVQPPFSLFSESLLDLKFCYNTKLNVQK